MTFASGFAEITDEQLPDGWTSATVDLRHIPPHEVERVASVLALYRAATSSPRAGCDLRIDFSRDDVVTVGMALRQLDGALPRITGEIELADAATADPTELLRWNRSARPDSVRRAEVEAQIQPPAAA